MPKINMKQEERFWRIFERSLVKTGDTYLVSLPIRFVNEMWKAKKGDKIQVMVEDDYTLNLRPVEWVKKK